MLICRGIFKLITIMSAAAADDPSPKLSISPAAKNDWEWFDSSAVKSSSVTTQHNSNKASRRFNQSIRLEKIVQ